MNRLKNAIAALVLILPLFSCASYTAYQKAQGAEKTKDWDTAVIQYEKALEVDPKFDLGPAEAGHPIWGPVFRNVKEDIVAKAKTR